MRDSAERFGNPINLEDEKPNSLMIVLLRTKNSHGEHLAVQVIVDVISRNLGNVLVFHFAISDVRVLSGRARRRRNVVGAASEKHSGRVLDIKTVGIHLT